MQQKGAERLERFVLLWDCPTPCGHCCVIGSGMELVPGNALSGQAARVICSLVWTAAGSAERCPSQGGSLHGLEVTDDGCRMP